MSNINNPSLVAGGFLPDRSSMHLCISASDNPELRLFYFILGHSINTFSVKIKKDKMVEDLRNMIIDKEELIANRFQLFKVNYQSLCRPMRSDKLWSYLDPFLL